MFVPIRDKDYIILNCLFVSSIPALAMTIGSFLILVVKVSNKVQASLQNFSAGVILAAVANELYPLLIHEEWYMDLSVVAGFVVALLVMFGLKNMEGILEHLGGTPEASRANSEAAVSDTIHINVPTTEDQALLSDGGPSSQIEHTPEDDDANPGSLNTMDRQHLQSHLGELRSTLTNVEKYIRQGVTDYNYIESALTLIDNLSAHVEDDLDRRNPHINQGIKLNSWESDHLKTHVQEMKSFLGNLESYLASHSVSDAKTLQSSVDSIARLTTHLRDDLQSRQHPLPENSPELMDQNKRVVLTEKLMKIHSQLNDLERYVLLGQAVPGPIVSNIREVSKLTELLRSDIRAMKSVSQLHPPPTPGAPVSTALVAAVTLDAMVDGFLVSLAYVEKTQAGLVMAFATCLEMGFLGLTYGLSVHQSTKNWLKRIVLVLAPPFGMAATGCAGGVIGVALQQSRQLFVASISFGVVALLFLVTQELLISARENQNGEDIWWVNVCLFLGILTGTLL